MEFNEFNVYVSLRDLKMKFIKLQIVNKFDENKIVLFENIIVEKLNFINDYKNFFKLNNINEIIQKEKITYYFKKKIKLICFVYIFKSLLFFLLK